MVSKTSEEWCVSSGNVQLKEVDTEMEMPAERRSFTASQITAATQFFSFFVFVSPLFLPAVFNLHTA